MFTRNEHMFTGRTVYSSVAGAEENTGAEFRGEARNQPGITHFNPQTHTCTQLFSTTLHTVIHTEEKP